MHRLALSRHVYARIRFGLLEPRDEHRCKDAEIPSRPVTVSWRQHLKPAGVRFGHQIFRRVCIGQLRAPAPSRQRHHYHGIARECRVTYLVLVDTSFGEPALVLSCQ